MKNEYFPQVAKVLKVERESIDTLLFTLAYKDKNLQKKFNFEHGQFIMVDLPGIGESAFDICSSSKNMSKFFQVSVRKVGRVTEKLHQLKKGNEVWIRGPFGRGFPIKKIKSRNLLLIGGGCGFVTLRSLILDYLDGKIGKGKEVQIFYGCLDEKTILFKREHSAWRKKIDIKIVLEKPKKSWKKDRGLITKLFDKYKLVDRPVAILCGPQVMYKFVVQKLKEQNIPDEDIYLSLERRMYCGVGVCQHCAIGSKYVCADGPVFNLAEIKEDVMQGGI